MKTFPFKAIKLSKLLTVLAFCTAIASVLASTFAIADTGTNSGGGGSEEARIFSRIAREGATVLLRDEQTKKFAKQLLDTLDQHLEINVVDNLDGVCPNSPESDSTNLYAKSCSGEINLLRSFWAHDAVHGKYSQQWLMTELIGKGHIYDILHEVFRASNPKSNSFITDDAGFSVTSGILRNSGISANGNVLDFQNNCYGYGADCSLPFSEEILDQSYSCSPRSEGRSTLWLNIIGINGKTRNMEIAGTFDTINDCQNRIIELNKLPVSVNIGKSYYCEDYNNSESVLYLRYIRADYSHFHKTIIDRMKRSDCQRLADQKTQEAHNAIQQGSSVSQEVAAPANSVK